jgi:DNA-binding NarL/FixJ family response regulator
MLERRTYQAVVCDIKMPVMDGVRMYELLERAYPAVARRVVFVSAWLDDAGVQAFLERAERPFLQKPFDVDVFVRTVRAVAEEAGQEATSSPG